MTVEALASLLQGSAAEVARGWLERHLAAVPLESDRSAVTKAHGRGEALVVALGRALSGARPEDWGDFSHREAVQLGTMMAWSLAEAGATPSASAALYPSLVAVLEELGAPAGTAGALAPLACVAAEGLAASTLAGISRAAQRRLAAATPVLGLPGSTVLVAATGSPSVETAGAIADRATDLALDRERPWVIVDLTHLEEVEVGALAALLGLAPDLSRLEGRCLVVGLSPERRQAAEAAGIDVSKLETRDRLEDAVSEALARRGFFERLRKRLR